MRGAFAFPAPREHVDVDHADDARAEIPGGCDRKAERASARKAEILKRVADVVRLARPLSVAHRQQNAARRKEVRQEGIEQQQRDRKARDALHEIGGNDQRAALRRGQPVFLLRGFFRNAKRQRDESDRDPVVGQHLKDRGVERVERQRPDRLRRQNGKSERSHEQEQKPGKHGRRHQAFAEEGDLPAQHVCQQHERRDHADLEDQAPEGGV